MVDMQLTHIYFSKLKSEILEFCLYFDSEDNIRRHYGKREGVCQTTNIWTCVQ